jgi:hypothetical protein
MKKVIFLVLSMMVLYGLNAVAGESIGYVKTDGNIYFGQKVKIGISKTKIISSDGTVVKIPNHKVEAYMHNSHLFELMPVSYNSAASVKMDLLEKITLKDGLALYRSATTNDELSGFDYYVYNDGKLYLKCTKLNTESVLQFFGINKVS